MIVHCVCYNTDDLEAPVVGFENLEYSISEGDTLAVCVVVLSGGSNAPFSLQMVSISSTATGKYYFLAQAC